MEKVKQFLTVHRETVILIAVIIALIFGGYQLYQGFSSSNTPVEEVDLPFDAEGPYALTFPRKDGNAMILNLKRTASYDGISYELAYTSKAEEVKITGGREDGESGGSGSSGSIDRGVVGNIDTKEKKGEYEQEILFGTCSKNVCKYDKGVENGTLTLHIKRSGKAYRMITQWHLQKPDVALGVLTSGDQHLSYNASLQERSDVIASDYKVDAARQDLANVGFSIINDLTGVPKLPLGKDVLGKVYALNVPIAKDLPSGSVYLELAQTPPQEAKIYRFDGKGDWVELDTKIDGSKLAAKASGAGIFAVLTTKK